MLRTLGLLTGLCLFAMTAQALEPPVICRSSPCSESQQHIERLFFANGALLKEPVGDTVYSGPCYVQGRGYNPQHKHWGVIFFDSKDDNTYFGGRFGFFHNSNPYQEMTAKDARTEFSKLYSEEHQVALESDYAFVHLNRDSRDIWYYWFTQDPDTHTVFLKAFWTVHYFLMCELEPNPGQE